MTNDVVPWGIVDERANKAEAKIPRYNMISKDSFWILRYDEDTKSSRASFSLARWALWVWDDAAAGFVPMMMWWSKEKKRSSSKQNREKKKSCG